MAISWDSGSKWLNSKKSINFFKSCLASLVNPKYFLLSNNLPKQTIIVLASLVPRKLFDPKFVVRRDFSDLFSLVGWSSPTHGNYTQKEMQMSPIKPLSFGDIKRLYISIHRSEFHPLKHSGQFHGLWSSHFMESKDHDYVGKPCHKPPMTGNDKIYTTYIFMVIWRCPKYRATPSYHPFSFGFSNGNQP